MAPPYPYLYIVKILVAILGLLLALLGGLAGLFILLGLVLSPEPVPLDGAVTGVTVMLLGLGLGGALAWHGGSALGRRASALFHPLPVWILLILYLPVIVLGQLLITFDLFPALTFPLFHFLGAAIPPFAILAFAGRAFQAAGFRWREIIIQFSGGIILAPLLALTAEIIFGLMIFLLTLALFALTPGGLTSLQEWAANIQDPLWLQNPENIRELILFPPVAITVALTFIMLGPIIEELVKPLGVVLMSYRRPLPAQAFLWGLAGGAGFALLENLFNTTLALEAWFFIMLLRIGATLMHCLASGLTGLGWQRFLSERRPWKLLGAYSLSVIIHAIWNSLVVAVSGLALLSIGSGAPFALALSGVLVLLILFLFLILTLAFIVSLALLTRRLRADLPATTGLAS